VLSNPPQGGSLNKVVYEENGEPQGYVIYNMLPLPGAPGARLQIRDLIWLNYSAYRAFWEHFTNMDLIQEMVWRAPAGDPLPHLILEPRMLKATAGDGILARLVDVKNAMTQRGYQAEGSLTFALTDEICPWNQATWKLETSSKGSRVTKTKQTAQITLPVSTLAMLLFNQITATESMRMHRLDANEPEALKDWDRVMQTLYKPACVDNF
ncbi:MAG: sterol carrier protein domain-containing protein, partial [Dehalococcoidales bacterium]|nr:sterol carrier protein domain-containing protein [Dehalococcoidales bacterium]